MPYIGTADAWGLRPAQKARYIVAFKGITKALASISAEGRKYVVCVRTHRSREIYVHHVYYSVFLEYYSFVIGKLVK